MSVTLGPHAGFVYKLSTSNVAKIHAVSEASRLQPTVVKWANTF